MIIFSGNLADCKQHISQSLESLSTSRGSFSRVWKVCRLYATGFPESGKLTDYSQGGIFLNKQDVSLYSVSTETPVFTGVNSILGIALYSNQ